MTTGAYKAATREIEVSVEPVYLDDQSTPAENHYVWAYRVRIDNHGGETVQLRRRYWRITDEFGRVQEVRGQGVVGVEPVIGPGQSFEYTSGTPVATPSAFMVGSYEMETADGERFEVAIPPFSLDSPHRPIQLN